MKEEGFEDEVPGLACGGQSDSGTGIVTEARDHAIGRRFHMVLALGLETKGGRCLDRGSKEAVRVKEAGTAQVCHATRGFKTAAS